ncbi:hypothetical protein MG293_018776 [Ovis ammon polii]|uniref:Uncharacterized protein n=1 Tax=Ovis ammon polii TaxID=230172 RepID=A0AAD4TND5_OVIAM|nr:hypothetical protein MG293_018776 [Ovis ammon polii]
MEDENRAAEGEQKAQNQLLQGQARFPGAACIVCFRPGPGVRDRGAGVQGRDTGAGGERGPSQSVHYPPHPPKLKILNEELRGRVTIAQCSVLLNIPAKTQSRHKWLLSEAQSSHYSDHHHGTDPLVRAHPDAHSATQSQ